jgi:peptidyl-prolyl cis-trans isomerase B (cyclophilin B)
MTRAHRLVLPWTFALGVAVLIAGCSPAATPRPSPPPSQSSRTGCPTSQPAELPAGQTRTVTITTQKGPIAIKVDGSLSPIAAGNFVALASCGFYDGVVFHRLVPGFVIQGGDPDGTGAGGPGYTIQDEPVTTAYKRGTVAMARTRQPNSQGSQFFIVLDDRAASALSQANTYAIFGSVSSGMEVVDAIAAMPNSGDPNNSALQPVAMDKVTVSTP